MKSTSQQRWRERKETKARNGHAYIEDKKQEVKVILIVMGY
jgi:hypothetical protein